MKASHVNVQVNIDTDVMSMKLRTIAKHAEALANELEAIDNTCEECGGPITTREVYRDYKLMSTHRECEHCRTGEGINYK